ncbi:uncharacterized protein LOC124718683 [Schistocerca piceifrons]|uniref:uncharacterized protein LOC124718683 n=1 Tax=Schistocerca piceifrons TaxID=274613 RepID=UPI001F5F6A6E|nr:uncharacterized protein LOC124718683 [Schistocerca piceifrons]
MFTAPDDRKQHPLRPAQVVAAHAGRIFGAANDQREQLACQVAARGFTAPQNKADVKSTGQEVKKVVHFKKQLYQKLLACKTDENWKDYREARNAAKKAVAAAKSAHFSQVSHKLETPTGEREIYRLAKQRNKQAADIEKFCGNNDEEGKLIINSKKVAERWRKYFEEVCNEEFPHSPVPVLTPVDGPIAPVTKDEV